MPGIQPTLLLFASSRNACPAVVMQVCLCYQQELASSDVPLSASSAVTSFVLSWQQALHIFVNAVFAVLPCKKQPHVRSAHQRQSGNQYCLYAQAHAICFVQGCSVRKGKSKQDDPPPFLTAQLGRYKD